MLSDLLRGHTRAVDRPNMSAKTSISDKADPFIPPSRSVHVLTGLAACVLFLASIWFWPSLMDGAGQAFGTVGLFLTAYGVLFSVIEVLRTQSATLAAGRAAERGATLARSPFDMRDVSECATTIEAALYALQHDGSPQSQPLSRIIRLYTAIFQERYDDDKSIERLRIGILQSHVAVKQRNRKDALLENTLAEMLGDISARGGKITNRVNEP